MNTDPTNTPLAVDPDGGGLAHRVGRLASYVGGSRLAPGERAALKRWAPGQAPPLTFYRLWLQGLGEELPAPEQGQAWMQIAWGLAMGVAHRRERPLGRALAESHFAEARLERLLAAPPALLPGLFSALVRFLGAKGETFDWLDGARLLLSHDGERREAVHRRIASHYYSHLPRLEKE